MRQRATTSETRRTGAYGLKKSLCKRTHWRGGKRKAGWRSKKVPLWGWNQGKIPIMNSSTKKGIGTGKKRVSSSKRAWKGMGRGWTFARRNLLFKSY